MDFEYSRKSTTPRQKRQALAASGGRCHWCGEIINPVFEKYEIDHVIALALGGPDTAENKRAIHKDKCHPEKTREDRRRIAKAQRVARKHEGTWPKSRFRLPCHKESGWKRKVGGNAERRNQ